MEKRLLTICLYCLAVAACLVLGACAVFSHPRFGKLPQGERLDLVQRSPHYRDGEFRYPIATPVFSKDVDLLSVLWGNQVAKAERLRPAAPIPAVKTDLKTLNPQQDAVVWLGHSSWFIQLGDQRLLIDPVFSDYAAPFSFLNRAFAGTGLYGVEDMPDIDCLLISHDHWDHLDFPTVTALAAKVKQVICPLGVGAYFEQWGYPNEKVHEEDWYEKVALTEDCFVHVLPARHYSGRLRTKNQTLWAGFALETPKMRIFFSGDSGYGPHFSEIGAAFKGFNLALLDCGQYDPRWAYIHMTPEEAARAARDLGARALLPAHVGRLAIANHPWDEPFQRLTEASRDQSYALVTPRIGELVVPDDSPSRFTSWWTMHD